VGRPAGARRNEAPRRRPPCIDRVIPRSFANGCAGSAITWPSWSRNLPAGGWIAAELDRGRLRTAAGPGLDRRRGGAVCAAGVEDCPHNICFVHLEGDKAATDAAFARAGDVVSGHFVINRVTAVTMEPRGSIGRLQPYRRPLHHLHHAAARAPVSRRTRAHRAEGAGEPRPRRRRRHRRQLRDEVGGLQRGRAGAAGLEDHRPPVEVGEHTLGGVSQRRPGARQTSPMPSLRSPPTHVSRIARQDDRRARRLPAGRGTGLRRQSGIARGRLSHAGDPCRTSPPCSPTPIRSGPTAATAAPRRPS